MFGLYDLLFHKIKNRESFASGPDSLLAGISLQDCYFLTGKTVMTIAILANEGSKRELLDKCDPGKTSFLWPGNMETFQQAPADAYFDLMFENDANRVRCLQALAPKPVFIHAVTDTLADIQGPFIRLNAWPGFISRKIIELSASGRQQKLLAASVLTTLGWQFRFVPDVPGLVTGRVIAMIINEAYFALAEGVSSKDEIDIAMKLGTNYPFGPFEWGRRIGLQHIYNLLFKLSHNDERYVVAPSLKNELNQK
jgi:3-hydroxybutyryl-CoA dehydrogenase